MLSVLEAWYRRYFSDPQAVFLTVILVLGFTIILTMGDMLAPVLAAIVIAYLLEGIVRFMERSGGKRIIAVALVTLLFMAFLLFLLFGMVPLLSVQVTQLIKELPNYLTQGQHALLQLPQQYSFISEKQVLQLSERINQEIASLGQNILTLSISSIPGLITLAVYLVLVPLLVFFFLKDKTKILGWFSGLLPENRTLAFEVWKEMDQQLGNYVRGKFWEIFIVGIATYIGFVVLDLKYAILLSVLVGLSVLIPYIGAAVVTIPVAVVAYFQWGWGSDFIVLMVVYGVIQALDGNLLVPLLFSEVVNLHPVAIIVSVLFFGGLWGFWGVFFAIPLATLVKALITAWPRSGSGEEEMVVGEG
jgi:putative permease